MHPIGEMLVLGCASLLPIGSVSPNPNTYSCRHPFPVPNSLCSGTRLQLQPRRCGVIISKIKMGDSSSQNVEIQQPDVQMKRVAIANNYGEKLVGVLHETGSAEIVILCHGFRSSKETSTISNLAAALTNEGISAFRFDFAGNGESEGSFEYGNYRKEADDLRAVILYFCDKKRSVGAILGHSKGGNVVLLYASRYHDVPKVINVSGRYNLQRGIEERLGKDLMQKIKKDGFIDVIEKKGTVQYRVTEESLMDRLGTDMHAACLLIEKDCRVLTVHGSEDEVIPVEDALEFDKIIPNHILQIVEGADHGYNKHQSELTGVVINFMKAAL